VLDAAEVHCDAAIALTATTALRTTSAPTCALRRETAITSPKWSVDLEGKLGWRGEVMLHFALGKEFEDLGEHARAFDHVAAGSDLQRRSINYDNAAHIAEIDRIIPPRPGRGSHPVGPASRGADPVFVVGLPRTGTTLVERIIASHSAMISVGETGAFSVELRRAMKANPDGPELAAIGRRYVDRLWHPGCRPTVVSSTRPFRMISIVG